MLSAPSPFKLSNQLTDCHEIWYDVMSLDVTHTSYFLLEVFSVVTPYSVLAKYQRFRGPYRLHLQGGDSMDL
jgi:hypothetical protein